MAQGVGVECEYCGFSNDPSAKFCGRCGRSLVREGEVTHPRFVIGKKGRPYCAAHTCFDGRRLEEYDGEHLVRPLRPHSLACKSCGHYSKDDCYFSAASIDGITQDIFKRRVWCDLCIGWFVASPVVVLQKIYWEQGPRNKGYVACPHCDRFLKTGQNSPTRYAPLILGCLTMLLIPLIFVFMTSVSSLIELFVALGMMLVYYIYRGFRLMKSFPEKRRNLKDYRRARDQGLNPKIFLAVD